MSTLPTRHGLRASLTPSWREPVERSGQDKAPTVSPSAVRGPSSFLFPVELGRRPGGSEMLLGIFGSQDVVNLNLSLFRFSRWSKLYGQSWGPPQLSVPVKCASAPRTLSCGRAGVLALRGRREVPP